MTYEQDVTLGEVYRLCLEIRKDVKAQNGRIRSLEKEAVRMKTLWLFVVVIFGFGADWFRHWVGL